MTIRLKLMSVFVAISVVATLAGSGFVLQKAIIEKSSYVNELNTLLVPQLASEIDQRLRNLTSALNGVSVEFSKKDLESAIANIKTHAPFIEALVLINPNAQNIFIQIANDKDSQLKLENLPKFNQQDITSEELNFISESLAIYKSARGAMFALVFDAEKFVSLFEISRGKDSFVISGAGNVLFSNVTDSQVKLPNLQSTGANIIATDVEWKNKSVRSAYLTKLNQISNTYVMIVEDKIKWADLAAPLFNSTISVLIALIAIALLAAVWLSTSLASPIEELAEKSARIGLGEWKKIDLAKGSSEIVRLASAFNSMIVNLQKREADLKVANERLIRTESLAAVGRIGAGVAHEVKNPLASILSYAQLLEIQMVQMLKSDAAPATPEKLEKIKNYVQLVMDDTRRASRIINDLLTFARQKELQTETTNILQFVTGLKEKLEPQCRQHQIDFSLVTRGIPENELISIDKEQIYQVIYNLVQNAMHALSDKSSADKQISLITEIQDHFIEISVSDNGSGISPENLNKIFEPFFSTKNLGQGSGLGLAISYGIIQMHGGQIHVSSQIGKGTQFKILLPRSAT